MKDCMELAKEIIAGKRLTKESDFGFVTESALTELMQGADEIRKNLCGDRVDLCSIINGRGGKCSENCKFCAQSSHYHTTCDEFPFLTKEEFMQDIAHVHDNGVDRYSIVTAGRTLEGVDLQKAVEAYRAMHEAYPDMILCASHGLMGEKDLRRLKEAGVTMYHANIETSPSYFASICSTHSFEDKLTEIQRAKDAGLTICSGGILGMGENWQDRVDMALELARLQVSSIPLNFLIPIPGTPLEKNERLTTEEILRIVALFRYVNPTAFVRIAAGRSYFEDGGKSLFQAGANATLTGDMLTTVGNNTKQDIEMLQNMGFRMKSKEEKR